MRGAIYSPTLTSYGAQNFRILLYARGIDCTLSDAVWAWAAAEKRCTSIAEGFGGADFDLGLEVEHYEQLVALKEELRARFGDLVAQMQVLSRFRVHKYIPYPFEETEEPFAQPASDERTLR